MRRQGEEYDLTTLPEILPQQPPPPPYTHTCVHTNIHSYLPLCHTHTHALHSPFPCSPWSPPRPPLPTTLLPGRNVFLSLSYTVFTQFPSPSTYSNIPHTLGPADPLREEVGELWVGNNAITEGQAVWLFHWKHDFNQQEMWSILILFAISE